MTHAADVFGMRSSTASQAVTKARIIYDKGFHGGNRAKDKKLSEEDREATRAYILCGKSDSQNHWLQYMHYSHFNCLNPHSSVIN